MQRKEEKRQRQEEEEGEESLVTVHLLLICIISILCAHSSVSQPKSFIFGSNYCKGGKRGETRIRVAGKTGERRMMMLMMTERDNSPSASHGPVR